MSSFKKEAFDGFDSGLRPSELTIKGVKMSTLYRYYQEWKKLGKTLSDSGKVDGINEPKDVNEDNKGTSQILTKFEQFKTNQQFLFEKGQLEARIKGLTKRLEDCDEKNCQWLLIDNHWQEAAGNLMEQLQGFALEQMDKTKTSADLQGLVQIVSELESVLVKLENEYHKKIWKKEQSQKEHALQISKKILSQKLDIELIPASVRSTVANTLLVQDENEADDILGAIIEYAARNDVINDSFEKNKEKWSLFEKTLTERRWDFINELKKSKDESLRRMYGEWLLCPICRTMNRVAAQPISAVYRCFQCGNWISKRVHGRIAIPA